MRNQIIAHHQPSDRNIYITVENDSLVSVNYSQGLGDIDLHFIKTHDQELTKFVIDYLNKLDESMYSPDLFFPSPYWDEQVEAIDNAIWQYINKQDERAEIVSSILSMENEIAMLQNQIIELRKLL